MLKDLGSLKNCWLVLCVYSTCTVILSLLPAITLWYSGQMIKIVESAVQTRSVDKAVLIRVAVGRMAVAVVKRLINHVKSRTMLILDQRIKAHYGGHIFEAYARLDLPTFEDPIVRRQLEGAAGGRTSVAWDTVQMLANTVSHVIQLVSQVSVLLNVLRGHQDGTLIALLSFISPLLQWMRFQQYIFRGAWAATCRNDDYIRIQGLKRMVTSPAHRKEIVAGNLSDRLIKEFYVSLQGVGDDGGEFYELRRKHFLRDRLTSLSLLSEPLKEMPQIVFALRAVQYPASIPVTLASLHLIQSTVSSFSHSLLSFFDEFGSVADHLDSIRKLYGIGNIRLKVVDGTEPYPENAQEINSGISVEFRHVSFKYPGSDVFALNDVSFKIDRGQLCVIVGTNGSGKSTILKLLNRLYDPYEGEILIDGKNIKTLRLKDLRHAIAVLFQDYSHFPLSIKDNIGLGDPYSPYDEHRIEQSAKAGGAYDFVEKLPDGFDAYLERPVPDHYSALPEGTKTLFGRTLDHNRVRRAGEMGVAESSSLSGGQMQRLAVCRTFMRSVAEDSGVGLLLFDEPSASLDPQAEHDLFERLRALRGNKTMIFSSHRFGNLTRHADVILYMKDSVVEEVGTHDSLLRQGGGYASIYNLQAKAFLP
ncbi:P-loop containing nucleoside triphosphate hydrolase protein [Fomitiporia mediterranea MF3/22]|uniref:P-loop containing nucleoside triphosphate hydrolase protein n=1 Tax=Fomitiporia mediterranea (strain MF3/22) TaxID=694068 RepID=UPI0004409866|nr:P-loop containing nucleoside triphosphate hydrolase protein [Fomitiporia mediterranea MF3/22]EJD04434.1 P-loop containing nucleoside triphosphate hydrolase protein [Fomitiporia mediterranea MF3/22]